MNIAFVHKSYDNIGGAEKNLGEVAEWFVRFGHEVHLYCGKFKIPPNEKMILHRVPYLRLGKTSKVLSLAFFASRAALASRHDVVISYSRIFRQDIVRCGGGTHKGYLETVSRVRGPVTNALRWVSDRAVLYVEKRQFSEGNYRRIIAMSEVAKRELMEAYSIPADRIEVIYNGVDISRYHPQNRDLYRSAIRKEYGIEPDQFVILFVGINFFLKGLEFLLQAVTLLKDDNLRLFVVGYDANQARYESMARRLGLAHRTTFAGPQKDVHRFYGAADILVLPSMHDPFGNVVLEALACGLPAITTKRVGTSEMLEGELRNYILGRYDDIHEIARMIEELTCRNRRAELSLLARKTAEKYSRESNARTIEKLCLEVVEEKSGRQKAKDG